MNARDAAAKSDDVAAACVRPSVLVVVDGELDVETCDGLIDRVLRTASGRRRVLLDLRAVTFVDVRGARALSALCDELRLRQWTSR